MKDNVKNHILISVYHVQDFEAKLEELEQQQQQQQQQDQQQSQDPMQQQQASDQSQDQMSQGGADGQPDWEVSGSSNAPQFACSMCNSITIHTAGCCSKARALSGAIQPR